MLGIISIVAATAALRLSPLEARGGVRWALPRGDPAPISRRSAIQHASTTAALVAAGVSLPPALAADVYDGSPGVKLSRPQINEKLAKIPVVALVNAEDSPFLTNGRIGYFFLDPIEALRELKLVQKNSPDARLKVVTLPEVYFALVRGEQPDLGGDLRLRPNRRQVVLANRALQAQQQSLTPTILDEAKGQVPVFYSEKVAFETPEGQTFPFFLSKEDLDSAFDELRATGGAPALAAGENPGIPIGLVRVATMDGLVSQMLSGEIDLTKAVLVAERTALKAVRSLVAEAAAGS